MAAAVRSVSSRILYCSLNQIHKSQQHRSIFSTAQLQGSWMDKVKNVFTGQKPTTATHGGGDASFDDKFTLLNFADELQKARKLGTLKEYIVGRSSEVTFSDAFEKHEGIVRYLGALDPSGENLKSAHKQEAAKRFNCTIVDVENTLAKFFWAKEAQKKILQLKEEGKPLPKSFSDVQKMVGSSPLDLARSNLAKSGQLSRNAPCPCGSKKKYKRCCGNDPKEVKY